MTTCSATHRSGCDVTTEGQYEGVVWGDGVVLYPDYGAGYTDLYICQNSLFCYILTLLYVNFLKPILLHVNLF